MLSPGTVLSDRYRLTERIAAGGMGEVWRGEDLLLHRAVAVKVLLPALMSDKEFMTRFRTEARMMAALRHPGIVQVYDYGENAAVGTGRLDYLVMEYIEGIPLAQRIEQAGRLSPAETMAVVAQVADALQTAHEAGIVHRDVKPSNLLVRPGGAIVLVDFGVARSQVAGGLTGTNVVLGSAHYMAPEQAEGRPISPATDVYALGAVAYCCLTGRPPFIGDNPLHVLTQLVYEQPRPLPGDVPPQVAGLVMRALAKDPAQRFASAAELASAARSPGQPPTMRPFTPQQARDFRQPPPGQQPSGRQPMPGQQPSGRQRMPGQQPSGRQPQPGFPTSGRAQPGFPTGGGTPQPGFQTGGRAPVGGPTPWTGSASVGSTPPPTGRFNTASGAASVTPPGAGVASNATPGAGVARKNRRRNAVLAVAVAALVLGVGGIAAAAFPSGESEAQDTPGDAVTTSAPAKKTTKPGRPAAAPATTPPDDDPTETTAPATTAASEPTEREPKNPHGPKELCGDGYKIIDQAPLRDADGVVQGRVYLLYLEDGDLNCAVTIKTTAVGRQSPTSAYLEVEGQDRDEQSGDAEYYAGPVTAEAAETCVKFGGSIGDATYDSPFRHCD